MLGERPAAPIRESASLRHVLRILRTRTVIALALTLSCLEFAIAPPVALGMFRLGIADDSATERSADSTWWEGALSASRASTLRLVINWSAVAANRPADARNPDDPAYNWRQPDAAVRLAARSGGEVLFAVQKAPLWAEGSGRPKTGYGPSGDEPPWPGSWKPSATELGKFGAAIAKRYNGFSEDPLNPSETLPRTRLFEAWNEPNYKMYLTPQILGEGAKRKVVAMDIYRKLLNSFYEGVKSVQPDALVSVAGLGPYGSSSQGQEIQPQGFARSLLCLTGAATKLRKSPTCRLRSKLDAISIHPWSLFGAPRVKAIDPDGGAFGNTPDFKELLDFAAKKRTILPAGPKQLWVTEFGWITNPPGRLVADGSRNAVGIRPRLAAAYTSEAIYRMWRWGVSEAIYFNLRDKEQFPSGLYFWPAGSTTATEATPKPSLTAFKFPLMAVGRRGQEGSAWAISPCRGDGASVSIQFATRGRWTSAATFTPDPSGMVDERVMIPAAAESVRGVATGPECSARSVVMSIFSK